MKNIDSFEFLFENAPLPYQSLDKNGNIIMVNKAWLEVLGYTKDEVIGKWFGDFLPSRSIDVFKKCFSELRSAGKILNNEIEINRKDGESILASFNGRIVCDDEGEFMRTDCIFQNITERKRVEKELRESEERFSLITDNMEDEIWLMDMDMNVTFITPSVERYRGFSLEDMQKMDWADHLTPESLEVAMEALELALTPENLSKKDKEVTGTNDLEYYCKDGSTVWSETTIKLLRDENGEPIGLLGVAHDITERKKAKETLMKNQYYLSKAQEIGKIGTWELDLINNALIWTDENYRVFGVPIGTPLTYEVFLDCIHPDDKEYVDREWKKGMKNNDYDIEHRLIVDGQVRWVREKADIEFDDEGKPIMAIGFTQDITERKKAENLQNVLLDIARSINTCKSLDELYPIIHHNLSLILETTNFFIALYDKERHTLSFPYYTDEKDEYKEVSAEKTNCHYIIRTGEALLADQEVFAHLNAQGEIVTRKELSPPLIWLGAPLKRGDEIFGVVAVQSYTNLQAYDENDKEILQLVSHQVANAIDEVKTEKALRESENRLNTIFESAPDAYYINDFEGTFMDGNKAAEELLGYSKEELVGKSFVDAGLLAMDQVEKALNLLADSINGKSTGPDEFILKRKDGTKVEVEILTHPVKIGGEDRILGIARDITARKKAEKALHESDERYRHLFNMISDAIYLIDQETGSIMDVNDTACEMYGYTRDEWLSMKNTDVSVEPSKTQKATKEPPEGIPIRYHKKKDGTVFPLEMTLSAFELQGRKVILAAARDITERKEAEKALQEANNIINRSPAVAFLWKNEKGWPVEFVSDNVKELFGYSSEELLSGHISYGDIVHVDDLGRVADEVQKNSDNIEILSFRHEPYRIITKDGEQKWVEDLTRIRRDPDGNLTHFEGIIYDITEQKNAETSMRESEERFRNLFNSSPEGIAIIGTDGSIQDFNPAQERLSNMPREDIIGRSFMDLQHIGEDDLEDLADIMADILSGKETEPFELQINIDDEPTWVEVFPALIKKGDKIEGILVITRDITDRVQAENAMRESEYKFRAVFHEALDGIVLTDAANGIIIDCNPEFERICGRTLSELRTLHIWDTRPEESVEDAKEMFDTLRRYGMGESSRQKIQQPDGHIIPIEFKARIINVRGNDYILSINRDITERLEAEKVKYEKDIAEAKYTLTKIMTDIVPALMTLGPQMAAGKQEVTREIMRRVDMAFFDKYFPADTIDSIDLETFGKQMCKLYIDMGGELGYSINDDTLTIKVHICPWRNEEVKNPILCMLGRGILESFGTKLFGDVSVQQENDLVNNGEFCHYRFHVIST